MTDPSGSRALLPLLAGLLGLAIGGAAVTADQVWLAVGAGALALVAGLLGLRLARRLDEQGALQQLVEEELRTVRTEAQTTQTDLRAEIAALVAVTEPEFDHDDPLAMTDEVGLDEHDDQLTDSTTGLFAEPFFAVTLDTRVAAARRHLRPVALALLQVVDGLPQQTPRPTEPGLVSEAVRTTLREADIACRLRNGNFALLLEDTPENGAIWTVERIRRCLNDRHPGVTLWAGVACYPAHAFSPGELLGAADSALISAREWRQDRIEVAASANE